MIGCEINELPLFRGCNRSIIEPIFENSGSRFVTYKRGEFIALQNSVCRSLFLLCEGSVYVRMTSEQGREFTLDTLAAPDVLASAFIFATEHIFPVTIVANTECKIWIVDRECVLELIEKDAVVLRNFLNILSDHSLFLSNKIQQFALQTLATRLVDYLAKNKVVNNLQETAFVLGVARPSLSRTLAQLLRKGVVRKTSDGYVLA